MPAQDHEAVRCRIKEDENRYNGRRVLTRSIAISLVDHARQASLNECCGIIFPRHCFTILIGLTNIAAYPDREFLIDHQEFLDACERAGERPIALYHSHPNEKPVPSVKDCRLMDALEVCKLTLAMVIIGLHPPMVRVFEKRDHVYAKVEEVVL